MQQTAFARQRIFKSDQRFCSIRGIVNVRLRHSGRKAADFFGVGLHAGSKPRHTFPKGGKIFNAEQALNPASFGRKRLLQFNKCFCSIRGIRNIGFTDRCAEARNVGSVIQQSCSESCRILCKSLNVLASGYGLGPFRRFPGHGFHKLGQTFCCIGGIGQVGVVRFGKPADAGCEIVQSGSNNSDIIRELTNRVIADKPGTDGGNDLRAPNCKDSRCQISDSGFYRFINALAAIQKRLNVCHKVGKVAADLGEI